MSGLPWVAFYPSDWLAGTRGLSAAETGIYISLIMMMYERGEPLANDADRLARMCGASKRVFADAVDVLFRDGKLIMVDGRLWNERVGKEQENREKNSEKQKRNAEARWKKTEQKQGDKNATALPKECLTTTTTIIEKEEPNGSSKKDDKRGSRIGDFEPDLSVAVSIGLSRQQAETECAKFRDYWISKPGQGGVKLNWPATWRNWCRTALDRLPRANGPPSKPMLADVTADLLGRMGNGGSSFGSGFGSGNHDGVARPVLIDANPGRR